MHPPGAYKIARKPLFSCTPPGAYKSSEAFILVHHSEAFIYTPRARRHPATLTAPAQSKRNFGARAGARVPLVYTSRARRHPAILTAPAQSKRNFGARAGARVPLVYTPRARRHPATLIAPASSKRNFGARAGARVPLVSSIVFRCVCPYRSWACLFDRMLHIHCFAGAKERAHLSWAFGRYVSGQACESQVEVACSARARSQRNNAQQSPLPYRMSRGWQVLLIEGYRCVEAGGCQE